MSCLVLLSGGMDSATCAALAIKEYGADNVGALGFYYGQRHTVENISAQHVAEALGIRAIEFVDLRSIFAGAGSVLIGSDRMMPHQSYEELRAEQGPSPTYVPIRNAVFMTIASAKALIGGYSTVYIGVHADDSRHDAYPDCRSDAIGAIAAGIHIGSYYEVQVKAPLQYMTKADIARTGHELGVPFNLTLSCYEGTVPACGTCPTCVSRLEAFRQAGLVDPIAYRQ